MARLAQRVMHLVSTQTHLGRAYEIDIALRPNGSSGLPVVSIGSFMDYQRSAAWTWEHQALTRARVVVGSAKLTRFFESLRQEVLSGEREPVSLAREILAMREKMRTHLDRPPEGFWDLKQGEGGLVDVEFLVQHAVLMHAAEHPTVVRYTDVWRQLEALEKAGCWPATKAYALLDAQRDFRARQHRAMLAGSSRFADADELVEARALVSHYWQELVQTAEADSSVGGAIAGG
jgi:glutamate-ammonia-ligase adenylyltransferase